MKKVLICLKIISLPWILLGIPWLIHFLLLAFDEELSLDSWEGVFFLIHEVGVNLIIIHPIIALKVARHMYSYTNGNILFVFYQGVVFAVIFSFLVFSGLFLGFSNPNYLADTAKIFVPAVLWGIAFPLGYYIYKKVVKQEKTN